MASGGQRWLAGSGGIATRHSFPAGMRAVPCTKVGGATIGMPRKGLSTRRSASPDTIVLVAGDCEFEKFIIGRIAAGDNAFRDGDQFRRSHELSLSIQLSQVRSAARCAAWPSHRTAAALCSDFKKAPRCATTCKAREGKDLSFSAALTKTLVSTTTLIQPSAQRLFAPA